MSIYRDDNDLYTRVWVTNDEELIMASHFFKVVMELPNSLSQTIFNQLIFLNLLIPYCEQNDLDNKDFLF